jgi:hypothetical protein
MAEMLSETRQDSVYHPPSFASVAAATKICRGVQATKHMRTSSQAAQAAVAIAPPPSLLPLPQVLSLTGPQHCTISPAPSLSSLSLYRAMGVARKLLSRPAFWLQQSVHSIFSGFPCFLILHSALPNSLGVYFNWRCVHFPVPTQNISSSTHHIKSFDACMEY